LYTSYVTEEKVSAGERRILGLEIAGKGEPAVKEKKDNE